MKPRVIQPAEMRLLTILGLLAFVIASVVTHFIFGIEVVLAYYGIGGIVGLYVVCVRDRREFMWRGRFHKSRALKHCIVVAFLWPFELLEAVGYR